jgi:hypothetical protein
MLSLTKGKSTKSNKKWNDLLVTFKGVKQQSAGFIATWSISSVIAVTELLLGVSKGTYNILMV